MKAEGIETDRLFLRKVDPQILKDLHDNCPKEELKDYLGITSEEENHNSESINFSDFIFHASLPE